MKLITNGAKVGAISTIGNNQTLMAVYTIPAGVTGYMRDYYLSIAKKTASSSEARLMARPFGQVFQVKHRISVHSTGTSAYAHTFTEPEVFAEKTDIFIEADTDAVAVAISAGFDIVLVDN